MSRGAASPQMPAAARASIGAAKRLPEVFLGCKRLLVAGGGGGLEKRKTSPEAEGFAFSLR